MRRFAAPCVVLAVLALTPTAHAQEDAAVSPTAVAGMQVQINQLHEEIRGLRGQLEQAQYQARMTADALRKYQIDADSRLQMLEQKTAAPVVPAAAELGKAPVSSSGFSPDGDAKGEEPASYQKPSAKPGDPKEAPKDAAPTGKDFPDANAHYNDAFKLLNAKDYAAAASSFDAFVKKYPKDPLTGNAYYWLGESYYARGDYSRASEGFRKGFEVAPNGQKAADNLYKLALSLSQVKRVAEACVVLAQVSAKYADTNASTAEKAAAEHTRLQCK